MATQTNNHTSPEELANRKYVRWDEPNIESIPPDEEADIQEAAEIINKLQKASFDKTRHGFSGTHARTQGIVRGTLKTEPNLPAHLKQSMFAEEREWPVACRYSSEPGDPGLDDRIPQPRGFGMKVFDVHGEFFETGEGIPTHDIEFNSTPAIDLSDAKTTKEILGLRYQYGGDKETLYKHLEARHDTDLQKSRDQVRNTHLESTRQYSQSAYRFGDYVMKYSLIPNSETQRKLYEETVKPSHGSDILHKWLQNFHRDNDAEYLFQVQLLENVEDQPVEYAGTIWDPEKYPWQTVARLTIGKQESFDYALKCFWEDRIKMDPWMGLKTLQPLGGANRLRKVVYPRSSGLRRKMNATTAIDVKSIDELPGLQVLAVN